MHAEKEVFQSNIDAFVGLLHHDTLVISSVTLQYADIATDNETEAPLVCQEVVDICKKFLRCDVLLSDLSLRSLLPRRDKHVTFGLIIVLLCLPNYS